MRQKIILLLIILLPLASLHSQDFISVIGSVPFPTGTKVYFEGYEGLRTMELGNIRVDDSGRIDYFTSYHGYVSMYAEGKSKSTWPLILEYDPVCLEWNEAFSFPCDPENEFFYNRISGFELLDSLIKAYSEATDSLETLILREKLQQSLVKFPGKIMSEKPLSAVIFLEGEFLIRRAAVVETGEDMAFIKPQILDFITDNYDVLYHSDMMIRLGRTYVGMNEHIIQNSDVLNQAVLFDISEWLNKPGLSLIDKEVVDFFLVDFLRDGKTDMAAMLAETYPDIVKCEQYVGATPRPSQIPYTFNVFGGEDLNKMYSLDRFHGISKILALYSTECPASVAAVAGLYDFMGEKQIRIPVILVPNGVQEGELAELLQKEAPFGLQTGQKIGSSLIQGAGIKQFPAFIILDEGNLLKEVYYGLADLKSFLAGNDD
jgi:hypothetical protein